MPPRPPTLKPCAVPVVTAVRGPALTWTGDPFREGLEGTQVYEPDAIVAMADGVVTHFGPARRVRRTLPPDTSIDVYGPGHLILPGFVDCHVHYPQTPIIGAYGEQLIHWLNHYAFVAEQRFADKRYARRAARFYLQENLRHGITTAAVFCTVHPGSVDAFFEEAQALGMRTIAGKVLMDRNAPDALTDTAQRGYDESQALIMRWHGRGRASYAITPRFAPTSTPAQLEAAGALRREHPGVYVQSHISESRAEVAWVREVFPERAGYLDVYDHFSLVGRRTIYGHGLWLTEDELARCAESGTAIAHCPTSNFFLGSGAFDLANAVKPERPVRVGLATDLGGGTTFSILGTLNEAYKAAQLHGYSLSAGHALYLATRGGAHALDLDDRIGSLAPGMEADLVVLDLASTPAIRWRMKHARDLDEALFVNVTMADDRAVRATYVGGRRLHDRAPLPG
jgi:guanine deaminase